MTTWFISDLHLEAAQPAVLRLLEDFLQQLGGRADALYILGDLFEYWVGDDALDSPLMAAFQPILKRLRRLSAQGVKLYFMHGNRDFLVGERFAETVGCTLLPEQHLLDLYGTPTLLMHGDTLCTDDVAYQKVRQLLRSPQWQAQFLSLPLAERVRQAEAMRAQSRASMQGKAEYILDVNPAAVLATMQAAGAQRLVHGHTHRPATHPLSVGGLPAERIVLGDWHPTRHSFLRISQTGVGLVP